MKKIGLLLFILIVLTGCNDSGKTEIAILNPEITLGSVPLNSKKDFYIKIKNEGNSDLKISKVQPSCRCIADDKLDNLVIKKHETDSVKLTLQPNAYGDHTETVAILSNTEPGYSIVHVKSFTPDAANN